MNLDEPEDRAHTLLAWRRCSATTRSAARCSATIATVEAMGRDEIAGFFDRWYRPASIVVVGRRAPRPRRGRRGRGGRPSATGPAASCPSATPPGARARRRVVVEHDDTEQAHLASAGGPQPPRRARPLARWPWPTRCSAAGWPAGCSRRSARSAGLAYAVHSHPALYSDAGCLMIYAGTGPKRARETLHVIDDVVAALAADGITEARAGRGHRLPRGIDAARPRGQRQPHGPPRAAAWSTGTAPRRSTSTSPASAP